MHEDPIEPTAPPSDVAIGIEMSLAAKVANAVLLLTVLAAAITFVWVMSSLPYIEGTIPIKGVQEPIKVARDSLGIARITARNQHDAYFALGYVHAQDRMWQMEMQRRIATGRLAEVVGDKALANDRFMRTLGIGRAAEAGLPALDQPTRDALAAYADGVNAWLDTHRHRLPLEFRLLSYQPERWRPADSLAWARVMALQLSGNWHDELSRLQLSRRLDPRWLRELWPPYPAEMPVTLPGRSAAALIEATPEAAAPRLASNVWVVAGTHTRSGRPLLANDPHLGFQAPVLWYLVGIEAPELSLSGATIPGLPFHLIGHNGRIAWGMTATHADTIDLFVEKAVGTDSYQTPKGPQPFRTRQEVIRIKGGDEVTLTVRETRHGPVISDVVPRAAMPEGQVVAFSSTLLATDDLTAQAFYRLNRAADWKGFVAALKDFHSPVQNLAYADTSSNIGFYTAGRVPMRRSGDGRLPAPGWTGEADWAGWVPFTKMPQAFNPRTGRIINANNKVVGDDYPYLIAADWPDGYRAARIAELLKDRKDLTIEDMAAMQLDAVSRQALELKELLAEVEPRTDRQRQAMAMISAWNGAAAADRPEPMLFAAWTVRLNRAIFADELGDAFPMMEPLRPAALIDALTRDRHWCDDVATPEAEGCDDVVLRSLDEAVAELSRTWGTDMTKWRWGDAHRARFDNPVLGKVPLLSSRANLQVPVDGDDFTVDRGSYLGPDGEGRFPNIHGPGLRAVFDMADLSRSRFILATGQSGNPLSRHYADMIEDWRANRGATIGPKPGVAVMILEPQR